MKFFLVLSAKGKREYEAKFVNMPESNKKIFKQTFYYRFVAIRCERARGRKLKTLVALLCLAPCIA